MLPVQHPLGSTPTEGSLGQGQSPGQRSLPSGTNDQTTAAPIKSLFEIKFKIGEDTKNKFRDTLGKIQSHAGQTSNVLPKEVDSQTSSAAKTKAAKQIISEVVTPKRKTYEADDEFGDDLNTPLPDISYQSAFLESIEESALKIRDDDVHTKAPSVERTLKDPSRKRSLHLGSEMTPASKHAKTEAIGANNEDSAVVASVDSLPGLDLDDNAEDSEDDGGLMIASDVEEEDPLVVPVGENCATETVTEPQKPVSVLKKY